MKCSLHRRVAALSICCGLHRMKCTCATWRDEGSAREGACAGGDGEMNKVSKGAQLHSRSSLVCARMVGGALTAARIRHARVDGHVSLPQACTAAVSRAYPRHVLVLYSPCNWRVTGM